eukprot:1328668-Prymnesium_polylepis.1
METLPTPSFAPQMPWQAFTVCSISFLLKFALLSSGNPVIQHTIGSNFTVRMKAEKRLLQDDRSEQVNRELSLLGDYLPVGASGCEMIESLNLPNCVCAPVNSNQGMNVE